MSIYAVYLDQSNPDAWETIKKEWPDRHYFIDDKLALVAPEGLSLSSTIMEAVGIGSHKNRQGLAGIVTEIQSFNGFYQPDLWEWVSKVSTANVA